MIKLEAEGGLPPRDLGIDRDKARCARGSPPIRSGKRRPATARRPPPAAMGSLAFQGRSERRRCLIRRFRLLDILLAGLA